MHDRSCRERRRGEERNLRDIRPQLVSGEFVFTPRQKPELDMCRKAVIADINHSMLSEETLSLKTVGTHGAVLLSGCSPRIQTALVTQFLGVAGSASRVCLAG